MKKDFLNEKRQREKEESLDEIEKDMINTDSYKNKKLKLENSKSEISKINFLKSTEINVKNDTNNLDSIDISELVFNYNSINNNIKCNICQKYITNNIKFFCNTCSNFIFCIKCFIYSDHPKSHDYHLIDNLNFPLFTEDWTANEEHKLISNISKCGLNNWEEVSKLMNNKGQVECESHYYSFYNINQNNNIPDENEIILDDRKNKKYNQIEINKNKNNEMIKFYSSNPGKSTVENEKENQNIKRNSRSLCVRKNNRGGGTESISEILGVRKIRKEFDNEFLNDSEIELSHLEFNEDLSKENEKDLNLKFDILKDYNLILNERDKRKNFIFERGLLDLRRQNRIESKLSKEEYDLLLFMRPFYRFYENSEFFEQFESVIIEQQLKLMLKTLNKLENEKNSKGGKISTLEDIEKYFETEKNVNKGRKHNNHEHNKEKEKEINYENNLLANRIERYYEFNKIKKEKKIEEIFDEEEFNLVKEMPLARSTFYDIKIKIKDIVNIFKEKKNEKNENLKEKIEKLIEKYNLEKQTQMEIFEFYCRRYKDLITINENEIRKDKDNKKGNRSGEITIINEDDDIKSESVKSNKNRHKNKKNKEKNNHKNKIIKSENIIEEIIKCDNDNKMDIEIEPSNLNKTIENKKNEIKMENEVINIIQNNIQNNNLNNKENEKEKEKENVNIKNNGNLKDIQNENIEIKNNENIEIKNNDNIEIKNNENIEIKNNNNIKNKENDNINHKVNEIIKVKDKDKENEILKNKENENIKIKDNKKEDISVHNNITNNDNEQINENEKKEIKIEQTKIKYYEE